MARSYRLLIPGLTSLTTTSFLQLATPAKTGIRITEIVLGQSPSTNSFQTYITLTRRTTASTLPTAGTIVPMAESDSTSLLTSTTMTNAVGIATVAGTVDSIISYLPFNVVGQGLYWSATRPEHEIAIGPSGVTAPFLTMEFPVSPGSLTFYGHVSFIEVS